MDGMRDVEEEGRTGTLAQPQNFNMNIRNFLPNENTPVPITRDLTPGMQQSFRAANAAVRALSTGGKTSKRATLGPRIKWTDKQRFTLGQLAATTSTANALKKAQEWYPLANESTIRNFRKYYLKSLAANPDLANSTDGTIPGKKRGKPLLFGEYDKQIVECVRRLRRHGAKVNRTIVMGSARNPHAQSTTTAI